MYPTKQNNIMMKIKRKISMLLIKLVA